MDSEKLNQIHKLISSFTSDGTPAQALFGDKMEAGVLMLTCAMIANENLAAAMDIDEQVDAAINFYNVIQERIGYYRNNQAHALEKLL